MIDAPPAHAPECAQSMVPFRDERCPGCAWMLEQEAFTRFVLMANRRRFYWPPFEGRGQG